MKNKIIGLMGLTLAMGIAPLCNASMISNQSLAEECHYTEQELQRFIYDLPNDICRGDVEVAAAYLDSASYKLRKDKASEAQTALMYAQHELQDISSKRSYCSNFAPKVKSVLARVIRINSQINIQQQLANLKSSIG